MTAEAQFWHWFAEHEDELAAMLEEDSPGFVRRVNTWLNMTHPRIGCQPAAKRDGALWDIYVTAHGMIENFDAVDALVAAAPQLRHFRPVAFVPPTPGVEPQQDVRFRHVMEDDRASVTLFVEGYRKDEMGSRMPMEMHGLLSALLGEYRCETQIGAVELEPLEEAARSLPPIEQLPRTLK